MQSTLNIFQLDRVEWEDSYACNYVNRNRVESANKKKQYFILSNTKVRSMEILLFSSKVHEYIEIVVWCMNGMNIKLISPTVFINIWLEILQQ